jgi:tetratricopeptide (TPR) repeat protein
MGFTPQQARVALAATDTGLDVQVALDTLLSNCAGSSSEIPARDRVEPEREPEGRKRPPFSRTASGNPRPIHTRDTPSPSNSSSQQQLQDHADKLLAQASEIGLSVFNKANAFWNVGKEKALKVYEERAKAATPAASGNSRPKWMQDRPGESSDEDDAEPSDGKDEEILASKPPSRQPRPRPKPEPPYQHTKPRTADLFSDEVPKAYVSPFRRGRPQQTTTSAPPPKAPSPVPLIQRKTVPASPGTIASSDQHKAVGTEKYKLGQYSEAENAYSKAIAVLPENHLLLVPLYNNRALTRLKTGDYSGVIEDTTYTLTLIGTSYHPAREAKVTNEVEGASVDLADGLVKAWRRRAEAWEGKEKWEEAGKDWECVAGCTWTAGNARSDGVRGAGRCRRMIAVQAGSPEVTKPSPERPVARPAIRRGPTPPSQALNKLREVNNALEMEDQARHELKDVVDARLLAWKAGKETNVRALIASLDTVLWPELGWVKVGMGELVSPGQVKVRYTKAIAKVHPDKVCTLFLWLSWIVED